MGLWLESIRIYKRFTLQTNIMHLQLTNVTSQQLEAIRNNFETVVVSEAETTGNYDVSFEINGELEAWKLFFAGGEYVMDKFRKQVNQ